jgi:hypothetical protein
MLNGSYSCIACLAPASKLDKPQAVQTLVRKLWQALLLLLLPNLG